MALKPPKRPLVEVPITVCLENLICGMCLKSPEAPIVHRAERVDCINAEEDRRDAAREGREPAKEGEYRANIEPPKGWSRFGEGHWIREDLTLCPVCTVEVEGFILSRRPQKS